MTSSADVDSLDGIVVALYASVSFPSGGAPDWARFRSLFDPAALMIRVDPRVTALAPSEREAPAMVASPVDAYIQRTQAIIDAGNLRSFEERELVRRTEVFGDVAQVFSSYERSADGGEVVRGVNSMQLVKDGVRWWIAAVAWTDESHDNPLPARLMPRSSP
ncbi:nuclear transport factor 2 family protein [Nannocystaceae bacterium ST9]